MPWDAFISHASEDKDSLVRPLARELAARGLNVWYDEFTLRIGDSLRRSIDRGLAESDYGIVILSPSFFKKKWPQEELNGLVARESTDQKVVLPVWHNIQRDQVEKHSPTLADRLAVLTTKGLDHVVNELLRVIKPALASGLATTITAGLDTSWENPLAPLTLTTLIAYAHSKDQNTDWHHHSPFHYGQLRRLFVNTMAQLVEAIEDEGARETLTEIYRRLLNREPDWSGIFAYQPLIFLAGPRGQALVEQNILVSDEYRKRRLQT